MKCINCGGTTDRSFSWQGLIICEECFKIVSHVIEKTKREMQQVFLLYTDMVRVALIKGELRPPVLPKEKTMPANVFQEALKRAAERLGEKHGTKAKRSDSDSSVSEVRDAPQGDDGVSVQGGVPDAPVSGRG